jgi:hypothetical protein
MVGAIPDVVKSVLDVILESEVFQDYRIIGNRVGTTLVLRYTNMGTVGNQRYSPMWKHRSGVNVTRDNTRLNTWLKDNSRGIGITDTQSTAGNIWQTSQTSTHEWNINAPVFQSQVAYDPCMVERKDNEVQTEVRINTCTIGCQTVCSTLMGTRSAGVQCEFAKQSVGTTCKIYPSVKDTYVQATACAKSLGVTASVETHHASSQCEKREKKVTKHDVGVHCRQSPGSRGRHVQTYMPQLVGAKTNTDHILVKDVATETEETKLDWLQTRGRSHLALMRTLLRTSRVVFTLNLHPESDKNL